MFRAVRMFDDAHCRIPGECLTEETATLDTREPWLKLMRHLVRDNGEGHVNLSLVSRRIEE